MSANVKKYALYAVVIAAALFLVHRISSRASS